jgi:hypothetical protein
LPRPCSLTHAHLPHTLPSRFPSPPRRTW